MKGAVFVAAAALPAGVIPIAAALAIGAPLFIAVAPPAVFVIAEMLAVGITPILIFVPSMIGHQTGSGHSQCSHKCQYSQPASAHKIRLRRT